MTTTSAERRLYIGSPMSCPGWEVYAEAEHRDVDYVGPLDRLDGLKDGAFSILYANVLDRLDRRTQALHAMGEWFRVLRPGGALIVVGFDAAAVGLAYGTSPVLERQIALVQLAPVARWTSELLSVHLQAAGFKRVRRAENLALFTDVSQAKLGSYPLSLSLLADRP